MTFAGDTAILVSNKDPNIASNILKEHLLKVQNWLNKWKIKVNEEISEEGTEGLKMSRIIAQETYDQVVNENMEEFSMTAAEAIEDAIKQFELQGVDLTNIIKDYAMTSSEDAHALSTSIKKLEDRLNVKCKNKTEILSDLKILQTECDKDIPHRVLAGKEGAYKLLINLMSANEADSEIFEECLKAMVALMTGQPDLLDTNGINLMMKYLESQDKPEIQSLLLKWIKECCIKHEENRQQLFDVAILDHLKVLLNNDSSQLLQDVCAVLRALVLDDDVRVEFGKAHEHARIIASHTLSNILELLKKYKSDEQLVSELLLTLSSLIVRNEFCKDVNDAGGLDFVIETLRDFISNQQIVRQAFKLTKVLAGNDECKAQFIQKGGVPVIADALSKYENNAQTASLGLGCIAALTLRSPENSKALFEAGLAVTIVNAMNNHPDNMGVQKSASWAIRNMVVRCRQQSLKFLELGVEDVLKENLVKFKECIYDIKSALRDLGCEVELKEEWTGKGGKIHTDENEIKMD